MDRADDLVPRIELRTDWLFRRATRVRREIVGPVPEGFRVNVYTEDGEVHGPALKGTCGVGGDWFTVRRDGMGLVDSRVMIHIDSGALLYTHYTGMTDLGPDAYERILRGELPKPGKIIASSRFQTADPELAWLNRLQAVAVGHSEGDRNVWDTYALS